VLNNVGLGQQCNAQANNCSVGTCGAGGVCTCTGTVNPNACGNRCVNFQTDGANCGGCGVTCGALGCSAARCNCPAGQTFSGGACRLNDGQACTAGGGTPCTNGCNQWFTDRDGDGFGDSSIAALNRCGTTAPGTPVGGGTFVRQGGDCCDIANSVPARNAHPGQTTRFGDALPASCVRSAAADHDYNCNGRNEGALTVDCSQRGGPDTCAAGNSTSGQQPDDIVPVPQVDVPDPTEGLLLCGSSVGPGTCAFFDDPNNPSPFGELGCTRNTVGFTQLPCN
jgi:hypothetical protein